MLKRRRRSALAACCAAAALALVATPASAQVVVGPWHGVLVIGPNILRIVVRVKATAAGGYEGELVSPDQSPKGIAMGEVTMAGDHLTFSVPLIGASFDGKWDPAAKAWSGQFKQGPANLPLTLAPGDIPTPSAAPAPPPAAAAAKPAPGKTVEGVTVTGQSNSGTRIDIDRRSYDISKDLQAQTGSIADALRNIPSVQVDVQGNVSLRGDPSVTIMIDGKPSSLFKGPSRGTVLQNLPANAFERVEVMTNPSAAFRPDGSGGIINLIPKKVRQVGRSGSVRVTAAPTGATQLNLNLSQVGQKLTLSGDAVWAHEKQKVTLNDKRSSLDPISGRVLESAEHSYIAQTVDFLIGRAALDYDPDSKTRISGELRGTGVHADAVMATDFLGQSASGAPIAFKRGGPVTLDQANLSANASWRRKFGSEPDHELVVDLTQDRNAQSQKRSETVTGVGARSERITNDVDTDQSHVKMDYTRPFENNAKLKTGYELEYDRSDFDNTGATGPIAGAEIANPFLTDEFKFDQAINGLYATWQQPIGKLTVLAGLRLEDTQIRLKDPNTGFRGTNDFTRFYPSLHLAWKVDDSQELRASYSERIARPAASDYNPFRLYRDPFNFTAGNPNLKPQITHSYELGYQYRKGFNYYLATLYYRENDRGVTDVVTDIGGGVFLSTKQNLTRSKNGGLELTAAGRLGSKLSYQLRADAFHSQLDASTLGFPAQSSWSISGGGALTYQATPKDQFQLVAQATGKRLTPQGYHEPMVLTFLGYRHQYNKDWAFSISVRDALASFKDTLVIDTPALKDRFETHVKLRAVFFQLTRSFGTGPRKDTGIDYGTTGVGAGASPR